MAETRRGTFCGSPDHALNRRGFLGPLAAGAAAFAADMTVLDVLKSPALAGELKRQRKRVILLWLAGGSSQLETWDPKPGTPTGGPFRSIPTCGSRHPHLRADAEDGPADGPHLHHPLAQHQERRPRRRRPADDARPPRRRRACAIPTWERSSPASWARRTARCPTTSRSTRPTEGRRMAPGSSGFLGERYAPDVT